MHTFHSKFCKESIYDLPNLQSKMSFERVSIKNENKWYFPFLKQPPIVPIRYYEKNLNISLLLGKLWKLNPSPLLKEGEGGKGGGGANM